MQNHDLLQYVVDHHIAVESCITSNIQTKAVATLEEHPVRKFFEAGVVVVPCCDNTTVSNVRLSGEYHLLQAHFKFTPLELVQMIDCMRGYGYLFTCYLFIIS